MENQYVSVLTLREKFLFIEGKLQMPSDKRPQLIFNGDWREILDAIHALGVRVPVIFADPPDNLGLAYNGMVDKVSPEAYDYFLRDLVELGALHSDVFWMSYYYAYARNVYRIADRMQLNRSMKHVYWRYTFGQHRDTDFGNGHRPILRLSHPSWLPDVGSVKIESERQRIGDARAAPGGRVPDDVWDFPRVTGNSHERRSWHPTQHPEALMERIYKSSRNVNTPDPLKLVIDLFGGTGTTLRVAERLNVPVLVSEQSSFYCEKMSQQTFAPVTTKISEVAGFLASVL